MKALGFFMKRKKSTKNQQFPSHSLSLQKMEWVWSRFPYLILIGIGSEQREKLQYNVSKKKGGKCNFKNTQNLILI